MHASLRRRNSDHSGRTRATYLEGGESEGLHYRGTGLVGNNCIRLLEPNHEVHALVRAGHDPRPFQGLNVTFHQGDLTEIDKIPSCTPAVDAIIHAAGDTHIGKRPRPIQHVVNVEATAALALLAQERGSRFVFVSSVDALPAATNSQLVNELTPGGPKCDIGYVTTKRTAESDLLSRISTGLDGFIVNPGFMLGPWDWKPSSGRMLVEVARRFTPFAPSGGFSVCDVRDVAAAIVRLTTGDPAPNRRYILAGHNITYLEGWKVFSAATNGRPPLATAGPLALRCAGWWGDAITKLTGREGDVNSGAIRNVSAISLLR